MPPAGSNKTEDVKKDEAKVDASSTNQARDIGAAGSAQFDVANPPKAEKGEDALIYSSSIVENKGTLRVLNPLFFTTPVQGVKKVYINGDYPNIRDAYVDAGVEVYPIGQLPAPKK